MTKLPPERAAERGRGGGQLLARTSAPTGSQLGWIPATLETHNPCAGWRGDVPIKRLLIASIVVLLSACGGKSAAAPRQLTIRGTVNRTFPAMDPDCVKAKATPDAGTTYSIEFKDDTGRVIGTTRATPLPASYEEGGGLATHPCLEHQHSGYSLRVPESPVYHVTVRGYPPQRESLRHLRSSGYRLDIYLP
jgi:hypothetical protein